MGSRKKLLIEKAPKHYEEGGLFFVDLHVDGLPLLVFRPAVMLAAIAKARLAYAEWTVDGAATVAECKTIR